MSSTKLVVDDKSVSVLIKPKDDKFNIPPFKRNHKQKDYVARLNKDKSYDVDFEVPKPIARVQKKFVFVPTCHLCGFVGHIRPNCFLLRHEPKLVTRSASRNTNVPKFVNVCNFCGFTSHICPNYHKLKNKHSVFLSRICDDISPTTSLEKLFHMLL